MSLVQSTRILPHQAVLALVHVDSGWNKDAPLLIEPRVEFEQETGVQLMDGLLNVAENGTS